MIHFKKLTRGAYVLLVITKYMQELLNTITQIIEDYQSSSEHHPQGLLDMGRNLSCSLFSLEKHRAQKHKEFEATIYSEKMNGEKVNAATNTANVRHPELYMLRRFMESAEKVQIQISIELKWLHAELLSGGIMESKNA